MKTKELLKRLRLYQTGLVSFTGNRVRLQPMRNVGLKIISPNNRYFETVIHCDNDDMKDLKSEICVSLDMLIAALKDCGDDVNLVCDESSDELIVESNYDIKHWLPKNTIEECDAGRPEQQNNDIQNTHVLTIKSKPFIDIIGRAVSISEPHNGNREILKSVCLHVYENKVSIMATDGKRVHSTDIQVKTGNQFNVENNGYTEVVIPSEIVRIMMDIKNPGVFIIYLNNYGCMVITNEAGLVPSEFYISFYRGSYSSSYPEVEKAFPRQDPFMSANISAKQFSKIATKAGKVSGNDAKRIFLYKGEGFVATSTQMEADVKYSPDSSVSATMRNVSYEYDNGEMLTCCNGVFLGSLLKLAINDDVQIDFYGSRSPIIIRDGNPDIGITTRMLLMPLRV